MANKMRWRYGDTKPVVTAAVPTDTVIEIGDLIALDSDGFPYPASDETWDSALAATQDEFHANFLGVAMQASRDGDTAPIRVATEGAFEFDCAAAQFKLGDLVGPAKQSGNALESQKVVAVSDHSLAVGRASAHHGSNTTTLLVAIKSTKMAGGEYAPDSSGS